MNRKAKTNKIPDFAGVVLDGQTLPQFANESELKQGGVFNTEYSARADGDVEDHDAQPVFRESTDGDSIFTLFDLIKRYLPVMLPLIVATHAGLMLTNALPGADVPRLIQSMVIIWAVIAFCSAIGVMGLFARFSSPLACGMRSIGLIFAVWALCLVTSGAASGFIVYLFIITAIFPLLLPLRYGLILPWAAAAAWLSIFIFPEFNASLASANVILTAGILIFLGLLSCGLGRGLSHYRQLHLLAHTDELTGLSNRRHFREAVERETDLVRRDNRALTLITFDLDSFKRINDEHGHVVGDAVLRHFAEVLRLNTRRNDVVARIGGDEFAVVLPDMNADAAVDYVQGIQETLSMEFVSIPGGSVQISASAGVVTVDKNGPFELEDILQRADDNLYQSKRKHRRNDADHERRKRALLLGRGRMGKSLDVAYESTSTISA